MDKENDGTAIVLVVMSPGVSTVEALTSALDVLFDACGVQAPHASNETYSLVVNDQVVYVGAQSMKGLHAGLSTLENMLVPLEGPNAQHSSMVGMLPSLVIPYDTSRYEWRGFHLDVARHFFNIGHVLTLVQTLATFKINVFHLHLTDDQGWRLPKHPDWPLLTEIGSRRWNGQKKNHHHDNHYAGHYTRQDIALLVLLCQELNVQLIPEIDLPGHAGAILASYPFLGCHVPRGRQGSVSLVPTNWGELNYALCLKYKYTQVLDFSTAMVEHVMELFPTSTYIHLGGDEIPDQSVTRTTLVSFFNAMALLLKQHQKKMVVWDEILFLFHTTTLPTNTIVQAWQSTEKVRQALVLLHKSTNEQIQLIASPQEYAYLNKKGTTVARIKQFNPMPCNFINQNNHNNNNNYQGYQNRLMGGSLCLWSEYVPDVDSLYEHAFPRTEAFANALWSSSESLESSESSESIGGNNNKQCVFTSMKTYMDDEHSYIVQNVADEDQKTMFWSEGEPFRGDHVTIQYNTVQKACGIHVLTGGDRHQDRCQHCKVRVKTAGEENIVEVGSVAKDGSLYTLFDAVVDVKEIQLVVMARSSRDWLMVRHMALVECGDEGGASKKQKQKFGTEL